MKKKKLTFLFSIATLCLCFSILAFGVYAAKKASLTTTGSVSFEAHNCKVRVLGSVEGAVDSSNNPLTTNPTLTDDIDTSQGKVIEGAVNWEIGDIYFDDLGCSNDEIATPIKFTFKMTNESDYAVTAEFNLSGDFYIEVFDPDVIDMSEYTPQTNLSTSLTFTKENESDFLSNSKNICLINKLQTITATLSIIPKSDKGFTSIDLSNIKILFEKANVKNSTDLQDLTYTLNTTTNTASVHFPIETSTISSLTIPTAVSVDDTSYLVTGIDAIDDESEYAEFTFGCIELMSDTENDYTMEEIEAMFAEEGIENPLNKTLKSITIPNSINYIGTGAFMGCLNLSSLTIKSKNCISQGFTFTLSTNLSSFAWEGSNLMILLQDFAYSGLTSLSLQSERVLGLGGGSFCKCSLQTCTLKGGEYLNLPVSFYVDGEMHFALNTSLTNVVLEGNNITLGEAAFAGCSSLSSVSFKGEVEKLRIGGACFNLCSSLSTINFANVKSISFDGTGGSCFSDTSITSLTLPKDTSFGSYCHAPFSGSAITTITYLGTKDEWNAIINDDQINGTFEYANVSQVICTDETINIPSE